MRLIDADALLEQMKKLYQKRSEESNMTGDRAVCVTWNDAVFCINDAPTIDAVPVVHGKWIDDKSTIVGDIIERYCSLCGQRMSSYICRLMPYCPNCGAKMRPTSMSVTNGGDHDAAD